MAAIALLVGNAFRSPSQQMRLKASEQTMIELDPARLARDLADTLAIATYADVDLEAIDVEPFKQLHELLEERFPEVHRAMDRERVNELSLLYRWEGRDESLPPMLLMSHLDVVPIEESTASEWQHPPHAGIVADGFVWGRGALDVKCGFVAFLTAAEALIKGGFVPQRTIYLALGHDEEVGGGSGNRVIAERFKERGVRLGFVLDEGGVILDGVIAGAPRPIAFVAIAEKRTATLELSVRGDGGHSSMPGRSAVTTLGQLITRLDAEPMPIRLTNSAATLFDFLAPEMPLLQRTIMGNRGLFGGLIGKQLARTPSTAAIVRSTINFTQLRTDTAANQTPSVVHATINARLLPGDGPEDVRDHMLRVADDLRTADGLSAIECQVVGEVRGDAVASVDHPDFLLLQRTIHEIFPDVIVAAGLTSVSTDSSWYYDVADNVYRFIPMRLRPEDITRIHGTNERIAVENLREITQFYARLIMNMASERSAETR